MPTVSSLNVRLGLLSKEFERDLAGFERRMQSVAAKMGSVGETLTLAMSAPLAALGGIALKTAAEFESLTLAMTTSFENVGIGSQAAAEEIQKLQEIALAPGLDFEQAVKGSVRLQGVGVSAEKARLILKELGNQIAATGGSADQLDSVTKQFTQIIGKGRILQEDLSIILENMPGLAKVLRDEFGTTSAEAIRALGVSAEDFIDRITNRMATMPRVAGGLANAFTNAGVAIRQSFATVGEAINKAFNVTGLLNRFSEWIVGLADSFAGLDESTQAVVLSVAAFALALGPSIKAMSLIVSGATSVVATFSRVAESFRITAAAGTGTIGVFSRLNTVMKANVYIAIASAVLAIAAAFAVYASRVGEASESQRIFAEAQQSVAEEAGKETAVLNKNFEILKSVTASTEERTAAIEELRRVYPDYLRGVDLEKASLVQLTEIQGNLNQEIIRGVAERQKSAALEQQFAKAAQAQLRIQQIREKGFAALSGEDVKRSGRSLFGTDFEKQFVQEGARAEVVADVIKALEADIKQATTTAKELGNSFDTAFGIGSKAANRQYDALTRQRQAAEDAKDALEDMTPAQREALAFSQKWDAVFEKKGTGGGLVDRTKEYKKALDSIRAVSEKGDVLGADLFNEQVDEISNQIERLIEVGFKPYEKEVQTLRDMLKGLREDAAKGFSIPNKTQTDLGISTTPTQLPGLEIPKQVVSIETGGAIAGLKELQNTALESIEANTTYLDTWTRISDVMTQATEGLNGFSAAMNAAAQFAADSGDVLGSMALSIGDAVSQAAAQGAQSFGELANAAIKAGADIVRSWIQQGVAAAVSKALSSLPFPFNLAAGAIAGAAAATLFNKAIASIGIPALASGGVASGPSLALIGEYPGAATNPEIVAPENKLRQIYREESGGANGSLVAVVRGDDLLFLLDKAANRRGRVGG
ncbi:MAG: tape measure protein [Candidatus Obscuribacter sp.]|nr:tape measure protein [Candidatus Obscuribacter sp.]